MGLKSVAQFRTKAGVSDLFSWMAFANELSEQELEQIPDYILSDTLEKDLDTTINVCAMGLKDTKYLPNDAAIGSAHGALPEGEREGAYIKGWADFEIIGSDGGFVYTEQIISDTVERGQSGFAAAFWLIVKDVCDDGLMLSQDWYRARILYEYYREYPVPPESAFLIGELFKELCVKQAYEGELSAYYANLQDARKRRQRGASSTKKKAEELREYCVNLFVEIAENQGPGIMFAPAEFQARELRKVALKNRPGDFKRSGKPYSDEWFLRNIIEDRKIEIIEKLEERDAAKRL